MLQFLQEFSRYESQANSYFHIYSLQTSDYRQVTCNVQLVVLQQECHLACSLQETRAAMFSSTVRRIQVLGAHPIKILGAAS